jgi:outer membrane protein assembly factor BamB
MRLLPLLCLFGISLSAQEWTRFRGPNGSGISEATGIPTSWTRSNYRWIVDLPGRGHSSPVLWGDMLFVTCTDDTVGGTVLLCYHAKSGQPMWRRNFSYPKTPQHKFNSFATSTPALDSERVYLTWGNDITCVLLALTHGGEDAWERNLGPLQSQHGFGFSPIVVDGKVIVQNEQLGASSLVAFDSKTGALKWQAKRESGVKTTYSTPCLYTPEGGKPQLVLTSQAGGVYALSPEDGKEIWRLPNLFTKRTVASPVIGQGLVFGSGGAGNKADSLVAVQIPGRKSAKPKLAYKILARKAPYVPTSVIYASNIFVISDVGVASCHDVKTGAEKWMKKLDAAGGFFGSPVCVNGVIYCISKHGDVAIFKAADSYQPFDTVKLFEESYATPSVANDHMYLRTARKIYCLGN